jgi:two-component system invasion response regulator UvrY
MMSPSRLIIADDHQVVRQGLRAIIEQTTDMMVIAEATDGAEAERLARELAAELLILDISLPAKRGLQVLESLRASGIQLPVLFFSMHPASQYLTYARRHGAQGFVGKDANSGQLLRAIRRIVRGGTHFPPSGDSGPATHAPFKTLSRREAEVCRGLVRGEPLATIAERLGVGAKSVSTYRRRILDKLGLNSNADLIALAAHHGEY